MPHSLEPRNDFVFSASRCRRAFLLIFVHTLCHTVLALQTGKPVTVLNNTAVITQDLSGCSTESSPWVPTSGDGIVVNILIQPKLILHCKYYVLTKTNLSAKAEVQDAKYKNISLYYEWNVKNATIAKGLNASAISFKFDKPDENQFLSVLVSEPAKNETGSSKKELVVRDPIKVQDPKGKLFLEHGELLDITLIFSSGTNPIRYCYKFCRDEKVMEDSKGCDDCEPNEIVIKNQVYISYYFRKVGNYTLKFIADNTASRVVKSYAVKIADTIRPGSIPYTPIISSILAVLIVLLGLVLHLKLKRTLITETADFDFIRHDYNDEEDFWDNEEYTFIQRVRYLLFKEDRDNDTSVNDSILSGAVH